MRAPMRRSPLVILFVTVFLDLLGFGIVIPFLAYYVESFGARASTVGLLMSTFSLAQFLFAPFWGRISDRVGRRPILLIGLAGSVVGYLLFGFAASLAWLFAARMIAGISGATIPTAQAYIADSTTPANRAKGMGLIGAAFGLGFILGPALGGILSDAAVPLANALGEGPFANLLRHNPYALPSFAAAALAAINFVAAIFWLPESLSADLRTQANQKRLSRLESLRTGLTSEVGLYIAAFALFLTGHAMMESTATLLVAARLGIAQTPEAHAGLVRNIGWLFALIGLVSAIVQGGLVGRLSKQFGERTLLLCGLVCGALGLALTPLCSSWSALLPVFALISLGAGLASPTVNALISRSAPPDRQGATLGVAQSAGSLARVLGPVLGGALFQSIAPGASFWAAALLTALAFIVIALAPHPKLHA